MEITNTLSREQILEKAKQESERSDLKQHADKMIRGFENFNNYSSNRAIWELVQNACDLTKHCEVIIDYRKGGFKFTHNGKPFNTQSLISLIKQVSGKYGEENNLPEVGKYGTGFITTHAFGRKFLINSILEAEGTYFEIKDFLIDRSPKEWMAMSENIKAQKDRVFNLIQEGDINSSPSFNTSFTYLPETEQEKKSIRESEEFLNDFVPLVLTINDRLKKVTVLRDSSESSFFLQDKVVVKKDDLFTIHKSNILFNDRNITYFSLIDEVNEIEIILPFRPSGEKLQSFKFSEQISKLFLYYPLIGSENFGINFIINCKNFLPTEPRDGIHLSSNKDQVKEQEETNRELLIKASQMIFAFLQKNIHLIENPVLVSQINFVRDSDEFLLNEYFQNLQERWIAIFADLPLVETSSQMCTPKEVVFFDYELLENEEIFEEVYQLTSKFFQNIPKKGIIKLWSQYAIEWDMDDLNFISHKELVQEISKRKLDDFEISGLKKYYSTLISEGKLNLFDEYAILPNIDGEFRSLTSLRIPEQLTEDLITIGKVLIPESMKRLTHQDFYFDFDFEKFSRRIFSNEIKNFLDEVRASEKYFFLQNFEQDKDYPVSEKDLLDEDCFIALLDFCKLNNNINSNSKPAQLLRIISRFYSLPEDLIYLPKLEKEEDNIDSRSSRKILVNLFFNVIEVQSKNWIENNIQLLYDIAECNEDSLKEIFEKANIYPNQNIQLRNINELKRDVKISEEIKNLFFRATGKESRKYLVHEGFNKFVNEENYITEGYLATQIENIYFEENSILAISGHPHKEDILKIISNLTEERYSKLFHRLNDKKATLMMELINNDQTKDDIFSIVTLEEDQIKRLGQLVKNKDFDNILKQATIVLRQEKEKKSDFHHKYKIGTTIENLIREKLGDEIRDRVTIEKPESLEASDVQGGQDIIVKLDSKPIYFIEVKSRWNSENSISMSKLQLERAVEQNTQYALCSVDITKYTGVTNKYALPIEEILPLVKFVQNIGSNIEPLIQENLIAEQKQGEAIHLIDYRGIIPQEVIKAGQPYDDFINFLVKRINKIITDHA
ncbi:hypothetical protein LB467_11900 [Salegentibacter sp. JZCK2]|uniref:sacsin N-terminal ATP-binding-like domain-containing protein n=1 Tax=Salegentibacter tibetensis TaxID=2873600 RepID=UPI001CCE515D|nr:hypothetical protein [Salegentibacter tibetensis]MBZ9730389.1 hypothetical protein [Salegentibacter tibetensis]